MTLSIKKFQWSIQEVDKESLMRLIGSNNLNEIISRILVNRGVVDSYKVSRFLFPTLRDSLPDPFHLLDMKKAAELIADAIENRQKIVIFGDYDVDGATSSALLRRFFSILDIEVDVYIPDRIDEGYGPTTEAFKILKEKGAELIITVDCGTSAFEAIDFANQIGLKIIVIDHHLSPDILPKAHAIVNPNRKDETSKYGYMAAVGVAFLTSVAIISTLRARNYFNKKKEPSLISLLDIVALGTICDVVPLEDLNRTFVVQGLKIINQLQNSGIRAFYDLLKLDCEITPYHLGYVIGPRINACGRVGQSWMGSKLLSTDDKEEAMVLALQLEQYNAERRAIEHSVFEQALIQAESYEDDAVFITVIGNDWHQGVVGIVAGRLKEIYNKPIAALSLSNGVCKASCRSINGVDFGSAVVAAKSEGLLLSGGGHKMAAGFTVAIENLEKIKLFLEKRFLEDIARMENKNLRYFDAFISPEGVNVKLAKEISQIGPFGPSNPEPKFMLKEVNIFKTNVFGENHLSCFVGKNYKSSKLLKVDAFRSIGTELGDALLSVKQPIDIIGSIRLNRWKGNEIVNFVIDDIIKLC